MADSHFLRLVRLIRQRIDHSASSAHATWFDSIDRSLLEQMNRAAIVEIGVSGNVLELETDIREFETGIDEPIVVLRTDQFYCQQAFSNNVTVSESLFVRKKNEKGTWVVKEEHHTSKRNLLLLLDEWIVYCGGTVPAESKARYQPPKCTQCGRKMTVSHTRRKEGYRDLECKCGHGTREQMDSN